LVRVSFQNPPFQPHILFSSRRKENVPLTVQEKRAGCRSKLCGTGILFLLNIALTYRQGSNNTSCGLYLLSFFSVL